VILDNFITLNILLNDKILENSFKVSKSLCVELPVSLSQSMASSLKQLINLVILSHYFIVGTTKNNQLFLLQHKKAFASISDIKKPSEAQVII
jgi:hypothetical protein